MYTISELNKLIEQEIENLKLPESPRKLYNPIQYILSLGGKRIRPILLLLSHQLFNENIKSALPAALSIEVFHNFTLLHDDIMDKAPLRRGYSTVHNKFGYNNAILSGDTMLIKAYELLLETKNKNINQVLNIFNSIAIKVCEGQQLDMDFESKMNVSIDEYLDMIKYKTSMLFAGGLQIGGVLGGCDKKESKALYNFGIDIGIAFQLQDDLLDLYSESSTFGKKQGGDILVNKKTVLYLKALDLANMKQKRILVKCFSDISMNPDKKISVVKSIFDELDIVSYTTKLIGSYYNKSIEHLKDLNSSNKKQLIIFIENLLSRRR
ncbi:MAG: polyprenyl synthetase family protein [Bacteroidota bacterium]|nr:polyprenyl synthetase family protein [Bacteroidota bacterium]